VENLYQESGLNYVQATGVPGAPAGTIAISGIKTYTTTQQQTSLNDWNGLYWNSGGGVNYQPSKDPTPREVYVAVTGRCVFACDRDYCTSHPVSS
jgi:hypothetical protein